MSVERKKPHGKFEDNSQGSENRDRKLSPSSRKRIDRVDELVSKHIKKQSKKLKDAKCQFENPSPSREEKIKIRRQKDMKKMKLYFNDRASEIPVSPFVERKRRRRAPRKRRKRKNFSEKFEMFSPNRNRQRRAPNNRKLDKSAKLTRYRMRKKKVKKESVKDQLDNLFEKFETKKSMRKDRKIKNYAPKKKNITRKEEEEEEIEEEGESDDYDEDGMESTSDTELDMF